MGLKIVGGYSTFRDREEAGRLLARELSPIAPPEPLVLGIPRGGLIVGLPIALELSAEMDVVAARKLRAPWNPELAVGAVMEGGATYLNESLLRGLAVDESYLEEEKRRELEELRSLTQTYRKVRPLVPREGRNLIVVDDGVATGATMIATLQGLRGLGPAALWCALPVGPRDTLEALADNADEVICLSCPPFFQAVGQFYARFDQVSDAEVVEALRRSLER